MVFDSELELLELVEVTQVQLLQASTSSLWFPEVSSAPSHCTAQLQYSGLADPCRTNLVDCSVATSIGVFSRRVHAASALELFLVSPV